MPLFVSTPRSYFHGYLTLPWLSGYIVSSIDF
jgi:hypothetical protein